MANVVFDEDQEGVSRRPTASKKPTTLVKIVYKLKLAKTQRGADYVLVTIIVLCVVLSYALLSYGKVFQSTPASAAVLGPQQAPAPAGAVHVP